MGGYSVTATVEEQLTQAHDWLSYYELYQALYRELLERRWGFGRAAFANQLHHLAVPDATGSVVRSASWAVYSQPSPETLVLSLRFFGELLVAEPVRLRSNRYLFLVPTAQALTRDAIAAAIGTSASQLDFWSGSLEAALSEPPASAAVRSAEVLMASSTDISLEALPSEVSRREEWLRNQLEAAIAQGRETRRSVIPLHLRTWLVKSSFLLASFRLGIMPQRAAALINDFSGVAALVARERVMDSGWGAEAETYFNQLRTVTPLRGSRYKVVPGDTLSKIVRQRYEMPFHVLWPVIRALNPGLSDPNWILAGQSILLPDIDPPGLTP